LPSPGTTGNAAATSPFLQAPRAKAGGKAVPRTRSAGDATDDPPELHGSAKKIGRIKPDSIGGRFPMLLPDQEILDGHGFFVGTCNRLRRKAFPPQKAWRGPTAANIDGLINSQGRVMAHLGLAYGTRGGAGPAASGWQSELSEAHYGSIQGRKPQRASSVRKFNFLSSCCHSPRRGNGPDRDGRTEIRVVHTRTTLGFAHRFCNHRQKANLTLERILRLDEPGLGGRVGTASLELDLICIPLLRGRSPSRAGSSRAIRVSERTAEGGIGTTSPTS